MEAIDEKLNYKHEEKNSGHLEKPRKIYAVPKPGPCPSEGRGPLPRQSARRSEFEWSPTEIKARFMRRAVSIPSRVIMSTVKKKTLRNAARPTLAADCWR